MTDVSKISRESEKQALELLAQANIPITLQQAVQNTPVDTKSVQGILPAAQKSSHPQLEKPAYIDAKTYTKGMDDLRNFLESSRSIEELINDVLIQQLSEIPESYAKAQFAFLEKLRELSKKKHEELGKASDTHQENSMKAESWGSVTKTFSSAGLALTGAASLATAATPAGLAMFIIGGALFGDQLLSDAIKKKVAAWIAQGNKESEADWLNRIRSFCVVASTLLSFGAAKEIAFQVALSLSQTALTATKSLAEYRVQTSRALREELADTCREVQKSIDQTMDTMFESCELERQTQQMSHQIHEGRNRLAHTLFQLK